MSPRTCLVAGALLAALCLTGCGNPSAKLIGKWKVAGGSGGGQEAAGLMQMFNLETEFTADGKWTISASLLGQSKTESGTWKFVKADGQALVLMAKLGQKPEREVRVEFTDNDHFSMVPPSDAGPTAAGMKLDFARQK